MDFHLLIVISCVFLASLFSLLFINKFFRRKTFEEIIAEKKAMTDKIYAQSKSTTKKPKKLQQQKKEQKREKKQRQKEQQRDNGDEDSDAQSEQASIEDDEQPQGLSKTHVEFEPDPEILTYNNNENTTQTRRASITEKENASGVAATSKPKSKKDKKTAKSGILMNKNETVAVKETIVAEESHNNFEFKQPKDMVELKKQDKEKKEDKSQQQSKKEKSNKKEKQVMEQPAEQMLVNLPKELKQLEEKLVRQGSPKLNNNNNNNKIKQQTKKQLKETAATKELVVALDKLSETDTIGVSLLMNLFRRAELNRSEIQILIDYLLNKQQDMPATHAEWSDDICQKLKRQLEEKERALTEQLEASAGIQAKLRDLRTEVNTERAQMNATIKAYMEKLQSKEQEIAALNQDKQTFADKMELERQQFKAQVLREKQAGSQDLLAQLQMMQNEVVHKDKCISDLTCMMNASRQAVEDSQQKTSEIIQAQVQQIRALEQQRDDLEQISNNRVFELEQAKTLETENAESKVEIRNLQNALESANNDMLQVRNELVAITAELAMARNVELNDKQAEIQKLQTQNAELTAQIAGFNNKSQAQLQEQSGLQSTLDALKAQVAEKERQVSEFNAKNSELLKQLAEAQSKREQVEQMQQQQLQQQQQQHQAEQQQQIGQQQQQLQLHQQQQQEQHQKQQEELKQSIEQLKTDVAAKSKQLLEVEQQVADKFNSKEKELLQQLQEQKEKNNDLRTKNWKLVEALQFAEKTANENKQLSNKSASVVEQQQLLAAAQRSITTASTTTTADSAKDQKQIRELFQRLYPDAVKACAGTALSLSFDQWIEQVLASHIKQSVSKLTPPPAAAVVATTASSSSHKSTQSNSSSNHSTHNHINAVATTTASTETANNGSQSREDAVDVVEMQKLRTHNTQLRMNIDELTKLVVKTGNTLSDLETRAREQDEHWRSIVRSKDEKINLLQHSNGKQDI